MSFQQTTEGIPESPPLSAKRIDGRRFVVAFIFIPLLYLLIRYLPQQVFFGLTLVAALLTLDELYRLHFRYEGMRLELLIGVPATGVILANFQWAGIVPDHLPWLLILVAVLLYPLVSNRDIKRIIPDTAVLLFGIAYLGITFGHILLLRDLPDGIYLVFFLLLVAWGGDAGAFTVGKLLGRVQLAPVISPNKTVEGFAGGLVFGMAIACIARVWVLPDLTVVDALALGLLLASLGAAGDLFESAFKRSAGVKDSGVLFPGHGGMLDRVDSLLLAAPAFYYYVVLVKGWA